MNTVQILDRGLFRKLTASVLAAVMAISAVPATAQTRSSEEIQIRKCWDYRFEGAGMAQVASDASSIYLIRNESTMDAVSLDSGALRWTTDIGGTVVSNLAVRNDSVFFVRRSVTSDPKVPGPSDIRALSAATGITRWKSFLSSSDPFTLWLDDDKLAVSAGDGSLRSVTVRDGTVSKGTVLSAGLTAPAGMEGEDGVIFVTDDKEVRYFTISNEKNVYLARSPFKITAIGSGPENSIIWGDERGNLTSFDVTGAKMRWQFKSGAQISDIARVNGFVLAASNDDFVYAISPGSGNRVWKRRLSGRIQTMEAVGNKYVLVLSQGGKELLLIDAKNGKTAGQAAMEDESQPIASLVIGPLSFVVLSTSTLSKYSLSDCTPEKANGPR